MFSEDFAAVRVFSSDVLKANFNEFTMEREEEEIMLTLIVVIGVIIIAIFAMVESLTGIDVLRE